MSAPRWPAGRPEDLAAKPAAPAPTPTPTVDFSSMLPEAVEARAKELEDALRAARQERDEAAISLATARGGLVEAAGRGFEAALAAQRKIAGEEERLRTAALVVEAVETAHRPFAEAAHRLARVRTAEMFGAAQAEKLSEREGIEAELLAALDAIGGITVRWEKTSAEILEIRRSAAASGCELHHAERGYRDATVARAIQALGITFCRALAS